MAPGGAGLNGFVPQNVFRVPLGRNDAPGGASSRSIKAPFCFCYFPVLEVTLEPSHATTGIVVEAD